ncbi:hypothetical protein ACH5RR_034151 [Cinchona calisaya]|uniref:Reverse transcriptase n=1 Tax=Cinchona calisaya TaxID=153742 RepID=A0ABD2YEM9_9GENT
MPILDSCNTCTQFAFVLGRQFFYNIIIVHEYVNHFKNQRRGRNCFMSLKLDMSKVYRVEWDFLKAIMERLCFCETWIKWILKCLQTVSYSCNPNEERMEYLQAGRGMRQGDPRSPCFHYVLKVSLTY